MIQEGCFCRDDNDEQAGVTPGEAGVPAEFS